MSLFYASHCHVSVVTMPATFIAFDRTNIVQILEWNYIVGDKRQVDRLFMDILRSNQNGNICVVSFHHGSKDPELAEEARQLGLEPRYVYRVTQVRVGHRIS